MKPVVAYERNSGVAEWLRHSVSNIVRSTRVGSNPVVGTTNHKPTVNSVVHPSAVGKCVSRSNSEGTCIFFFFFFLVGYVEERPWWPIQSPNKGRKKKASS